MKPGGIPCLAAEIDRFVLHNMHGFSFRHSIECFGIPGNGIDHGCASKDAVNGEGDGPIIVGGIDIDPRDLACIGIKPIRHAVSGKCDRYIAQCFFIAFMEVTLGVAHHARIPGEGVIVQVIIIGKGYGGAARVR